MSDRRDSHTLAFFLLGLGLGAVAGLLMAPQSGEETRRLVSEKAEEGKDYVAGKSRQIRRRAQGFVAKGREFVNKGRERLTEALEAGKQTYHATLVR
jgi:gas vesicle protein